MKYAYSHSRLKLYDGCPQAFKFKTIDKKKEKIGMHMISGSSFHEIGAKYNKHLVNSKLGTDIEKLREIAINQEMPEEVFNDVMTIVASFNDYYSMEDGVTDAIIEKNLAYNNNWGKASWFKTDNPDGRDPMFRVIMDFCYQNEQGQIVIRDFKTDRHLPPASEIEKSFQLDIYAFVASLIFPEAKEFIIQLDYVRYQTRREAIRYKEDLPLIREKIQKKMERIEKDHSFKPKLSSSCDWCGYKTICPEYIRFSEDMRVKDITSEESAIELAKSIYTKELYIKEAKSRLKVYIEQNKPIEFGDQKLDYHRSEKTSFPDTESIIKEFIELGIDKQAIWDNITLSNTAFKKLMKSIKSNKEEIDRLYGDYAHLDISTIFKFKKIKEG